jgi:hypothetical protein
MIPGAHRYGPYAATGDLLRGPLQGLIQMKKTLEPLRTSFGVFWVLWVFTESAWKAPQIPQPQIPLQIPRRLRGLDAV